MVDRIGTGMKFVQILMLLILFVCGGYLTLAQEKEPRMQALTLTHDNRERDYRVITPSAFDTTQRYPLLMVLHPANTTAQQMIDMTQFEQLADEHAMVLVYPEAIGGHWNSSKTVSVDDVGFLSALIDTMIDGYAIDADQLYVLGYSSGGLMTHRLRCDIGEKLAGIISYAAPLTFAIAEDCTLKSRVSALMIHGTTDDVFPFTGKATVANGKLSGTLSANQTLGVLVSLNTCTTSAEQLDISGSNTQYRTFATRYRCDKSLTELYAVVNLEHYGWAGNLPLRIDNEDMTLNEAIFRFINSVRK